MFDDRSRFRQSILIRKIFSRRVELVHLWDLYIQINKNLQPYLFPVLNNRTNTLPPRQDHLLLTFRQSQVLFQHLRNNHALRFEGVSFHILGGPELLLLMYLHFQKDKDIVIYKQKRNYHHLY